ncbi:hypothetical protein [Bradyrhizobium sp. ARR65]|uniref:hypothetical protein n=1 Tax=Bradyrhizobium sp. ARR65 TaxID=1040989 RepID=UPI000466809D|nr:hypothetical protein [Bradyrhizobium sp. ARR65]
MLKAYDAPDSASAEIAHSIHVLTVENGAISTLTLFAKPLAHSLFPVFDLPDIIPAAADDLPNSGF